MAEWGMLDKHAVGRYSCTFRMSLYMPIGQVIDLVYTGRGFNVYKFKDVFKDVGL